MNNRQKLVIPRLDEVSIDDLQKLNDEELMNKFLSEFNEFKEFCDRNKRLPKINNSNEEKLELFMRRNKDIKEVNEVILSVKVNRMESNNYDELERWKVKLERFVDKNNRIPRPDPDNEVERRLYLFMKKYRIDPYVRNIIEYGKRIRKEKSIQTNKYLVKEFIKNTGRLPQSGTSLRSFICRNMNDPEIFSLYNEYANKSRKGRKYKKRDTSKLESITLNELMEFVSKNGKLPKIKGAKDKFEANLRRRVDKLSKVNKDIDNLRIKFKNKLKGKGILRVHESFERNLNLIRSYIRDTGELPKSSSLRSFISRNRNKTDELRYLWSKYNHYSSFNENKNNLIKFINKNNRLPINNKSESRLYSFMKRNEMDKELKVIIRPFKSIKR